MSVHQTGKARRTHSRNSAVATYLRYAPQAPDSRLKYDWAADLRLSHYHSVTSPFLYHFSNALVMPIVGEWDRKNRFTRCRRSRELACTTICRKRLSLGERRKIQGVARGCSKLPITCRKRFLSLKPSLPSMKSVLPKCSMRYSAQSHRAGGWK